MNKLTAIGLCLCAFASGSLPPRASADAVTDWNANAGAAAIAACISPADDPLHESRMYAMMHVAIHDALNAIDRRSRPYARDFRVAAGASAAAAVAAAARDVLVSELKQIPAPFPAQCIAAGLARVEADYAGALGKVPDGQAKTDGIGAGQAAAAAIVARRVGDGSDTPLLNPAYPQGTAPGEYRFTPGFPFAFATGWGQVTPFVLQDSAQFRPDPPLPVSCLPKKHGGKRGPHAHGCRKFAKDFNEVKDFGGDGVGTPSQRSGEQTEIALFWVESSPLQWNRIGRTVSADVELDLWENARLFGLLNMALADGYIASFATKYHYNYWRPVTAIHNASTDDNPRTTADPAWTPLRPTPPIPDYESAHSVQGGAAAQVFKRFFRTDHIRFKACSLTLPAGSTCNDASPVHRTYESFSHAARENAVSRIYVGFHFRDAVEEGVAHGRKIGDHAIESFLRPVR
jgi:hypothetical protein